MNLQNKKIGFIGCGNMAKAMIGAMVQSGRIQSDHITAADGYAPSLEKAENEYGIVVTQDNLTAVKNSDILFLAVKPNVYETVMKEIKESGMTDKIFVSIAPGKTLQFLEKGLGNETKILRTMPNTPATVGEGVTAICPNANINDEELKELKEIIGTFGLVEVIEEKLFDAVVAISGSSPAYVFMFIEALADAGVLQGMPRAQAYQFAAQAVLGSAKMVLDTGKHPGELKDMVCSPGGTTIEAVAVLEERGFRSAVVEAARICGEKSRIM